MLNAEQFCCWKGFRGLAFASGDVRFVCFLPFPPRCNLQKIEEGNDAGASDTISAARTEEAGELAARGQLS